jgi:ABC-type protease/lipase transport system fused ATPase/permease subunit
MSGPARAMGAAPDLRVALSSYRTALIGIFLISGVINILYLTGSLFMLEVYDRVLPSRSVRR